MGSTAYTKPLFHLVKCTILALPWSLTERLDAVLDESLDGFKVWWCWSWNHVLPGLKGDELQRCYSDSVVIGRVFSQVESDERRAQSSRDISWNPRIFGEWKDKAAAWHKLRRSFEDFYLSSPILLGSKITADHGAVTDVRPFKLCRGQGGGEDQWRSALSEGKFMIHNFWKHCSNDVVLISFHSLGYADSDNVSFVIFHECACQPYWSKWKTVFLLFFLQILFKFVQNLIIRSLDRAEQKWLNRFLIFTTVPENYFGKLEHAWTC